MWALWWPPPPQPRIRVTWIDYASMTELLDGDYCCYSWVRIYQKAFLFWQYINYSCMQIVLNTCIRLTPRLDSVANMSNFSLTTVLYDWTKPRLVLNIEFYLLIVLIGIPDKKSFQIIIWNQFPKIIANGRFQINLKPYQKYKAGPQHKFKWQVIENINENDIAPCKDHIHDILNQ